MDWRLKYNTAHLHPAALNKHFDLNLGFVCFLTGDFSVELKMSLQWDCFPPESSDSQLMRHDET